MKSNAKVVKVSTKEKVVELQDDRSLFVCMMMVCKRHAEFDIKETVGQYEFSLVTRSLFPAGWSMLHCSSKRTQQRYSSFKGGRQSEQRTT